MVSGDVNSTVSASIQPALFSLLPASTKIDISEPSDLTEFIVKVNSKLLENRNDEDGGDLESFGLSSTSSTQYGQRMVVFSVIKQSPF